MYRCHNNSEKKKQGLEQSETSKLVLKLRNFEIYFKATNTCVSMALREFAPKALTYWLIVINSRRQNKT